MIEKTLMIVGPGGIGKSPLDDIAYDGSIRVDPYRLRPKGPRRPEENSGQPDRLYARPELRDEIYLTLDRLGSSMTCLTPEVHWFPRAMVLSFWVRKSWQLLFLEGLDGQIGKAEIFAPAIPVLLGVPQIRRVFGDLEILILHPAKGSLADMADWDDLKRGTRSNCREREGLADDADDSDDVKDRVNSIDEEAAAWRKLIIHHGAREYPEWPHAEYKYPSPKSDRKGRNAMLLAAKSSIVEKYPGLKCFFLPDDDIVKLGDKDA